MFRQGASEASGRDPVKKSCFVRRAALSRCHVSRRAAARPSVRLSVCFAVLPGASGSASDGRGDDFWTIFSEKTTIFRRKQRRFVNF